MTESETIQWVRDNIPILIKPKGKSKYKLISPFTSDYAREEVIEYLGKELHKLINE